MGHRSVTEEAAFYLIPLLDPDRHREEITTLRERVRQLQKQPRMIGGRELEGLALWHDRNSNGVSAHGEVRPVAEWGIVSLSSAFEHHASHPDEVAWSPRGVTFRDGTTRPTYDLILRTWAR